MIRYEQAGRIAHITIDRPHRANSLTPEMLAELREAWSCYERSDARCAILAGSGDRAFSSGFDFTAFSEEPQHVPSIYPGIGVELTKPVIAAVGGHCIGAGVVLAQACDLVVATESTRFSYPEAKLGVFGGAASVLYRYMPMRVATEFLMLGESFDAHRAERVGMVNAIVPDGQHISVAVEWAEAIAAASPVVIRAIKRFASVDGRRDFDAHARTAAYLDGIATSADRAEGLSAKAEGRPPSFPGH